MAAIRAALLAIPESIELLAFAVLLIATAVLVRRLVRRLETEKQEDRNAKKV